MTAPTRKKPERRTQALTRERIVEAAVELLDAGGESGLTFRTLTERLATGPGAVYWHVANKEDLLGAATDAVVAAAVAPDSTVPAHPADPTDPAEPPSSPHDRIRAVAFGLFDAIGEHPWLATQLATQISRGPGGTVAPQIFESIGRQVRAMGVPEGSWFTAASALLHYILGAAGQNAANSARARALGSDANRAEFLETASTAWAELDPDDYPFTRAVAGRLRDHDDREQFLAGVDFVLAGIAAVHPDVGDGRRPHRG
ncbi:TetR/AcrR family transcriptional regulator [Streptomyces sp. SID3343]|uniref:TetR/AcrR family transcriptional regulator n=1 Tax=Streptomyces sp. SID3343 TaxID=2690260 RepID=UPI0013695684|nr:TetR/AcrR family transcriptional regulator [Streptomyces sp. SID3343]MYW02476.1 TetR family transcriptional regulator [Streptomyces sp. SID3343]